MEQYNTLETHGYEPVADGRLLARITKVDIGTHSSTYLCEEFPLKITLLHTDKNTPQSYQNTGTIIHALETFQTIITFTGDEIFETKQPINTIKMTPIGDDDTRHYMSHNNKPVADIHHTPHSITLNPSTEQIQRSSEIFPRENISTNINYYDDNTRNYHTNSIRSEFVANLKNKPIEQPSIVNNNTWTTQTNNEGSLYNVRPGTPFPSVPSNITDFPSKNSDVTPYSKFENINNIQTQNRPQIKPSRAIGKI
jgi:hypothetical protein